MKQLSTILTFDVASVCLDTLIQWGGLTVHPSQKKHVLDLFYIFQERGFWICQPVTFSVTLYEVVGAWAWNPDEKCCHGPNQDTGQWRLLYFN